MSGNERSGRGKYSIEKQYPLTTAAFTDPELDPDELSQLTQLTDEQQQYLFAYLDTGTVRKVAAETGVTYQAVQVTLHTAFAKAENVLSTLDHINA